MANPPAKWHFIAGDIIQRNIEVFVWSPLRLCQGTEKGSETPQRGKKLKEQYLEHHQRWPKINGDFGGIFPDVPRISLILAAVCFFLQKKTCGKKRSIASWIRSSRPMVHRQRLAKTTSTTDVSLICRESNKVCVLPPQIHQAPWAHKSPGFKIAQVSWLSSQFLWTTGEPAFVGGWFMAPQKTTAWEQPKADMTIHSGRWYAPCSGVQHLHPWWGTKLLLPQWKMVEDGRRWPKIDTNFICLGSNLFLVCIETHR